MNPLHRRTDLHWQRKLWHFLTIVGLLCAYQWLGASPFFVFLSALTIINYVGEIVRRRSRRFQKLVLNTFYLVMRRNEIRGLAGTTYLLTGTWFLVALAPPTVVELTLLFFAAADPAASLVGVRFGKHKILWGKSLEGFGAACLTCFIMAWIWFSMNFFLTADPQWFRLGLLSVILAIIGGLAELVTFWRLDDNVSFPLINGGLTWLFLELLNYGHLTQWQ